MRLPQRKQDHLLDMEYIITVHGEPVAVLRPLTANDAGQTKDAEIEVELAEMKALAQEIAATWNSDKSGVELINEQRRY